MTFLSASHTSLSEVTKSVKTLGVRDWLLVACVLFQMAWVVVFQRQTNQLLLSHAVEARPAIEAILKDARGTEQKIDKLVLFQFVECMRNAGAHEELMKRCEQAMNGIRPWR